VNEGLPPVPPVAIDLNETTPVEDFVHFVRSPRAFYRYFADAPAIPGWVVAKGLLGLAFFVWLSGYLNASYDLRDASGMVTDLLQRFENGDHPMPYGFGQLLLMDGLRERLASGAVGLSKFVLIFSPLVVLFSVTLTAASAYAFLPFVGVSPERRSFRRILLAGIFSQWWAVVGVVPGLGSGLASLLQIIFFTLGVAWMHGIGFFRSFLALYLIGWIALGITVVGSIALGFWLLF
jgi:hypothetical protein